MTDHLIPREPPRWILELADPHERGEKLAAWRATWSPRPCRGCGEAFVPDRRGVVRCLACRDGVRAALGRPRIPRQKDCQACGASFVNRQARARYCTSCKAAARGHGVSASTYARLRVQGVLR